jgi:hypothetical protein
MTEVFVARQPILDRKQAVNDTSCPTGMQPSTWQSPMIASWQVLAWRSAR